MATGKITVRRNGPVTTLDIAGGEIDIIPLSLTPQQVRNIVRKVREALEEPKK